MTNEFYHDGDVVYQSGKQALIQCHAGLCVTDSTLTDWITVYPDGGWSHDGTMAINKPIRRFLDQYASEYY